MLAYNCGRVRKEEVWRACLPQGGRCLVVKNIDCCWPTGAERICPRPVSKYHEMPGTVPIHVFVRSATQPGFLAASALIAETYDLHGREACALINPASINRHG